MLVAHRAEARGDLADRGVPVDLLVGAVITTAQRVEHTLTTTVLVVVEAQRLLAGVPLGRRVGLVAADPLEGVPIGSEPDLDPTVALAQDAGGLVPRRRRGVVARSSRDAGGGMVASSMVVMAVASLLWVWVWCGVVRRSCRAARRPRGEAGEQLEVGDLLVEGAVDGDPQGGDPLRSYSASRSRIVPVAR